MSNLLKFLLVLFEELDAITRHFFERVAEYYQDFEPIGKMIFIIFILFLVLFIYYVIILILRISFVKDLSKLQNIRTEYQITLNRAEGKKCNFIYDVLLFQKMVVLDDEVAPKYEKEEQVLISSYGRQIITTETNSKGEEFEFDDDKLKRRLIISSVLIIAIFISMFFTKYHDFDIIFESIYNLKYQEYIILNNFGSILFVFGFMLSILMTIFVWIYYYTDGEWKNKINKKSIDNTFDILSIIPAFIAVFTFLNAFVISPAEVTKKSMEPNYFEGDTVFILHIKDYDRFDVVIVLAEESTYLPDSEFTSRNEYYIKRIIGLPGETITIANGRIYINGIALDETEYIAENIETYCSTGPYYVEDEACSFIVPEDEYFLLGDNRINSVDSRSKGNYTSDVLYGVVFLKIG